MKGTILEEIIDAKRQRLAAAKKQVDPDTLAVRALAMRSKRSAHRLHEALADNSKINIIAEFKRASPSKGTINDSADPASAARAYLKGGAAAISVLTEEDFFKGSLDDLRSVRSAVNLPILRKDFIFDGYQIYEAAEAGADAILLIAAMLDDTALVELHDLAEARLGLDALVEVHTLEELERVKLLGAKIIGVNNRDLKNFNVSLDVSRKLILHRPEESVMITESGLKTAEDLVDLRAAGYSGFLIGETLMGSGDAEKDLRNLLSHRVGRFDEVSL